MSALEVRSRRCEAAYRGLRRYPYLRRMQGFYGAVGAIRDGASQLSWQEARIACAPASRDQRAFTRDYAVDSLTHWPMATFGPRRER